MCERADAGCDGEMGMGMGMGSRVPPLPLGKARSVCFEDDRFGGSG